MSSSADSTGEETLDSDVSLNELSVNHNNKLFSGAVDACVDALVNVGYMTPDELETEQANKTTSRRRTTNREKLQEEDKQYLLADNSDYAPVVEEESANLWKKAIKTVTKGKCNKEDGIEEQAKISSSSGGIGYDKKCGKPAFDMDPIMVNESMDGGNEPPSSSSSQAKAAFGQGLTSSDYSIDGESAILWGDDPEKAYFAYMMEQEDEKRALEGKDQDDSLVGDSVRQELLNNRHQEETGTLDGDSTTLGHASKALGWDHSTAVGASGGTGTGVVSSLTPSHLANSQDRVNGGRLPNVIFVSDGTHPNPHAQFVTPEPAWRGNESSTLRNGTAKSKSKAATPKPLGDGQDNPNASVIEDKGWYTNRLLIAFALFFLILTAGLVAALIVYRNNYSGETSATSSSNLDENGNPFPTFAPTPLPTKKQDTYYETNDEDDAFLGNAKRPTVSPTWTQTAEPTWKPTWKPTRTPSFKPTATPTNEPTKSSIAPSETASDTPTETLSEPPTFMPTSDAPSDAPTALESMAPTDVPTTDAPSDAPTTIATMEPTSLEPSVSPAAIFFTPPTQNTSTPDAFDVPTNNETDFDNDDFPDVAPVGNNGSPPQVFPLELCQGDCDTDEECEGDLICWQREPDEAFIPGCSGTLEDTTDICVNALFEEGTALAEENSPNPTSPPTSEFPTWMPTVSASNDTSVTLSPTKSPTTNEPSFAPTSSPSIALTEATSANPTEAPSMALTEATSANPTVAPSIAPTETQSAKPTVATPVPTALTPEPTFVPTSQPPVPDIVSLEFVRAFILEHSPMSTTEMLDQESPQFKSLQSLQQWMAFGLPPSQLRRTTKKSLVQRWVLGVLYYSTSGQNWIKGSDDWMGDDDACDWFGKNDQGTCNSEKLVTSLDLGSNNMRGTLPKELSLLTTLRSLEMNRNDINGPLPDLFGRLINLVTLDFNRCDLTGTLPRELGRLTNLAILGLGRNDFIGTIPLEIAELQNLIYLGLERNDLSGTIPQQFSRLENLEYLALDWNYLSGEVPSELGSLVNLQTLILARNQLVGQVPEGLCKRGMNFMAADCEEVDCPCCDLCCIDGQGCAST